MAIVPTLVNEELTTVFFNVVPVNVPAAAVTVTSAEPSKETPLIVLEVSNLSAVAALPDISSVVSATVPVLLGRVIVLSAVGSAII